MPEGYVSDLEMMSVQQRLKLEAEQRERTSRLLQGVKPPAPETVTALELQSKEFEPIRWVVPGLLPEGVAILGGSPKIGKSWFVLDVGIGVSGAKWLFGQFCKPEQGDVLYLALEDNERRMKRRLLKRLGEETWPAKLHFKYEWARAHDGGVEAIGAWLEEHPECRLVVIDTLVKFRRPSKSSQSYYEQDYEASVNLVKLAAKHKIAILLVHHTRKAGDTGDILDSISGTQGLTGGVDTVLVLRRKRNDTQGDLNVTGRDIEDEQMYGLSWCKQSCQWGVVGTGPEATLSTRQKRVLEIVRSSGPIRARAIAELIFPNKPITRNCTEMVETYKMIKALMDKDLAEKSDEGYIPILS